MLFLMFYFKCVVFFHLWHLNIQCGFVSAYHFGLVIFLFALKWDIFIPGYPLLFFYFNALN